MKRYLFLFLLFFSVVIKAQTGLFFGGDRLSSTIITVICQDREGYIWVGTENGLNRFDGYTFTQFLHQEGDSTSLLNNIVTTLHSDKDGNLWVGTSKGLQRYDYATNSFDNYIFPHGNNPSVSQLLQLLSGDLVVGTAGYGLYLVHKGDHLLTERRDLKIDERDTYFNCLYEDPKGGFWKAGGGCFSYTPKGQTGHRLDIPFGLPTTFFDADGKTYAVCRDNFMVLSDRQATDTPYNAPFDISSADGIGGFRTALKDRKGNIFVGTLGNGLFWIPAGTKRLERYQATVMGFDLKAAKVWALTEDREGNIWVGCHQKGLLMIPARQARFSSWSFSAQKIDIGTYVSSVCQGDNGSIWCTVQNKGVYGFNEKGQITAQPQSPANVEFICRDKKGGYWLGTAHGFFSYDPMTGHSRLLTNFACNKFNAMADDGHGHLVISAFAQGILVYDQDTGNMTNYNMYQDDDTVHSNLRNNWVMTMMTDREGRVWLGTSSGVTCFDPKTRSFKPYGWRVLADRIRCNTLCETRQGDVLIGTTQGILIWHRQSNTTEPLSGAEQLQSLSICHIAEDNSGDLWCSTSYGIWHYQQNQRQWVSYISGAGLTVHEYIHGTGLHTANDRIFFPTNDGLTTFTPAMAKEVTEGPLSEVIMTDFYIGETALSTRTTSNGRQVTSLPVSQSNYFTLSYLDNTFTLCFSLLNYADAANTAFEHRLDKDDPWIRNVEGQNSITLNHLPIGTYQLEVRAIVNGKTTAPKEYTIVITPPWYRTPFAYIIYIIGIVVLLGLMVLMWWRHVRLNMEEEKMKFLINATHDIRSPLTLIMGALKKLREPAQDTSNALDTIDRNAQRILNLVNQILDVRKIDKQQMRLHCQQTDMTDFLQACCKYYDFYAKERNINFTITAGERLRVGEPCSGMQAVKPIVAWIDRTQMDKVMANLLSNAFKYCYDHGDIVIALTQGHDERAREPLKNYIEISITDTGTGMRENTLQHLFDRFYQGTTDKDTHVEGTGIGLNLCKMIVDMHHGTISGRNRTDGIKGSVFTVRLPQGNSHLMENEIDYRGEIPASIRLKGRQKASTAYRILLVDDDEEIPRYISQELGHYYHFTMCSNGRDAMHELLTNNTYHLVVSDVMMPEMDGFTMLRMIRTNTQINHLPVILLTSKADIGNRLEGLERGADVYLTKPFDIEELKATIDNLIVSRQRLQGQNTSKQQTDIHIKPIEVKGNDQQLMERIMDSINKHITDSDFTIDVLCTEVGISRANLHRKMKAMVGITATDFLRNMRMEQAARLLKEQKINVTQVAYSVGYSSLPYFSSAFKKHFGISPTEFIEQQQ